MDETKPGVPRVPFLCSCWACKSARVLDAAINAQREDAEAAAKRERIRKMTSAEANAEARKYIHKRLDKWIDDCEKRYPFDDGCSVGKLKLELFRNSAGGGYGFNQAKKVLMAEAVDRGDPDGFGDLLTDICVTETIEEY